MILIQSVMQNVRAAGLKISINTTGTQRQNESYVSNS